jgi:hypothetical protein
MANWPFLEMPRILSFRVNQDKLLSSSIITNYFIDQAQGGAAAIEDALSLTAVLPYGTNPEDVPERLQLYEKVRYERAHAIQQFTRLAGRDLNQQEGGKLDSMFPDCEILT